MRLKTHPDALRALRRGLARALERLRPPEDLTVDEWADRYRVVPSETSPAPGPWRTSRYEVARGPMRWATAPGVRQISLMACVQLLKTSVIENVIGRFVHLEPRPMILAQADRAEIVKFSKRKLDPMIEHTPPMRRLMGKIHARDPDQTQAERRFPGGSLLLVEASTAEQSFSMVPAAIVLLDEVDKWRGKLLSDPIEMARRRTKRYAEAGQDLVVAVCSPTNKGESRIEGLWLEGDQRKPFVPCPHCGDWCVLEFGGRDTPHGVKWDRGDGGEHLPATARYRCSCGADWTEADRREALQHIQWRQTKAFTCCGVEQVPSCWDWVERDGVGYALCRQCGERAVDPTHASGWASRLYDPAPLADLVRSWLAAQGHPARLAEFFREELGLPFESVAERLDPDGFMTRREVYEAEAPDGVVFITAGVDVQDDRLEVEVVGWGAGEESWSLHFERIMGDTSQPEVWARLEELLLRKWERSDGRRLRIMGVAIDSGHRTQAVYAFVRAHRGKPWWAIKGSSWDQRPGRKMPVWPKAPTLNTKGAVPLYEIGGQEARTVVMGRLRVADPGPGYCHWPADGGHDDVYFRQLARGYRKVPKSIGGRQIWVWDDNPSERCEAADCRVYAYAALCGVQQQGHDLDAWAAKLGAVPRRAVATAPSGSAPAPARPAARPDPAPASAPAASPPPAPPPHQTPRPVAPRSRKRHRLIIPGSRRTGLW